MIAEEQNGIMYDERGLSNESDASNNKKEAHGVKYR